uniref:Uncharacterized protein n=1 Tax=Arundo donax TaxID=35708 RepID=A0A0A8ZVU3_ARUDO
MFCSRFLIFTNIHFACMSYSS